MRSLRPGRAYKSNSLYTQLSEHKPLKKKKPNAAKRCNVLSIYYVPGTYFAFSKTISDQSNSLAEVDSIPVLQKKE